MGDDHHQEFDISISAQNARDLLAAGRDINIHARDNEEDHRWSQPDEMLQIYVGIANDGFATFDIVAVLDGFIVTGTIVGGNEFFKAYGDSLAELSILAGRDKEEAEGTRNEYHKIADRLYPIGEKRTDKQADHRNSTYLHIKQFQVLVPDAKFNYNNRFPYWRGRLSQVSAWTFGNASKD
jgi:hypothetical protein